MENLTSLYFSLLNNMWDVENQLIIELPKLIATANNEDLQKSLQRHFEETKNHKMRLEELLQHHTKSLTYERDIALETLLKDAASDISRITDANVRDALIIASAQTVEHIEMARYSTLVHWARAIDDEFGSTVLRESLNEEEHASAILASLASGDLFGLGLDKKAAASGEY